MTDVWMPQISYGVAARRFLILLLAADVIFLGVHFLSFRLEAVFLYSLNSERSYASIYTMIQEFWVVGCLAMVAWRKRWWIWLLAAGLGWLMLDDVAEIHERLAVELFGPWLEAISSGGLSSDSAANLGELVYTAGVFVFASAFLLAARRWAAAEDWRIIIDITWLVAAYLFFAVGVDLIHAFLNLRTLAFIEEGGEIITMSFLTAYAFELACRDPAQSTGRSD